MSGVERDGPDSEKRWEVKQAWKISLVIGRIVLFAAAMGSLLLLMASNQVMIGGGRLLFTVSGWVQFGLPVLFTATYMIAMAVTGRLFPWHWLLGILVIAAISWIVTASVAMALSPNYSRWPPYEVIRPIGSHINVATLGIIVLLALTLFVALVILVIRYLSRLRTT